MSKVTCRRKSLFGIMVPVGSSPWRQSGDMVSAGSGDLTFWTTGSKQRVAIPGDIPPPSSFTPLNLPKQRHQVETKYSIFCADEGHSNPNLYMLPENNNIITPKNQKKARKDKLVWWHTLLILGLQRDKDRMTRNSKPSKVTGRIGDQLGLHDVVFWFSFLKMGEAFLKLEDNF